MNDAEIKLQVKIDESSASKSVDTLTKKTEGLAKSFTNAGKKMTVGLTLPIAGLIGVGIKYNATVEDLTTSFKVMTGSAEEAGDIVKRLKDIGSKTPFEFTDLAETTKLLMNYGFTADDAIDRMKMLGDISQGSAEKMTRISTAYGQMSSAGKVNLEDVKQMIEAGFNPLKEISERTGESMESLYDRISKGKISVDEITESMKSSTSQGGKYFGSMDAQSKTTTGKLSTLKDGFLEATGSLTESLIPAFQDVVTWLTNLSNWFASLDEGQRKMILTVLLVVAALGPLLMIIGGILNFVNLLSLASVALNIGMLPLIITIALIVAAVVAVGIAIYQIIQHWETVKEVLGAMWQTIKDVFGAVVSMVSSAIGTVWNTIKSVFTTIGSFIAGIFKGVINTFISMINFILNGLNLLIKGILLPFNVIIKGLNVLPGVNIPLLKFAIPNIPKLEVGTNFVGQEGLAYLHQGEAVVPKKYNPAIGGGNGSYATLNIEMGDINMDGNKVGRAVTPYVTKTVKLAGGNV